MKVIPVPLFEDNYSYLVVDEASNEALAVDPAVSATYVQHLFYFLPSKLEQIVGS